MCDYIGCDNEPIYYDSMEDLVCEDCKQREIYEYKDATEDEFELIKPKPSTVIIIGSSNDVPIKKSFWRSFFKLFRRKGKL